MTPYQATDPFDWTAVMRLIQTAFAGMEGRIDPPSSIHRLTAEDLATQSRTGEIWVIGTPPIACAVLTAKGNMLYLGRLAVATGHRNCGHARALVDIALTRARQLGLQGVELQSRVELVENHAAFAALGFQQAALTTHPGFDNPTSITFRKLLAP